jgi:hypothetical protein
MCPIPIATTSVRHWPPALGMLLLTGCVTTMGSGVEPVALHRPPYYAGSGALPAGAVVAHAPVTYQRGATAPVGADPDDRPGSAIAALLGEMNDYLDRIRSAAPVPLTAVRGRPPDVFFGCHAPAAILCDANAPMLPGRTAPAGGAGPRHWLGINRPAGSWVGGAASALESAGATHLLVVTLELGEYWPREAGAVPVVELGTGHRADLRWHTDLSEPIHVLQLTGALLDAGGKALRIGAEGLMARPGGLALSLVGAQGRIRERDIEAFRHARREDLPGAPPVWQVALRALVAGLLDPPG